MQEHLMKFLLAELEDESEEDGINEEAESSDEEEVESSDENPQGYTDDNKLWLKPSKRKMVIDKAFLLSLSNSFWCDFLNCLTLNSDSCIKQKQYMLLV